MNIAMCAGNSPHLCLIEIGFGAIAIILAFVTIALVRYIWQTWHAVDGYREARNTAIGLALIMGMMSLRSATAWMFLWRSRRWLSQPEFMDIIAPHMQIGTIAVVSAGAIMCLREFLSSIWIVAILIAIGIPVFMATVRV